MGQAVCCRVAGEAITLPFHEAGARTEPERAMAILVQRPDGAAKMSGSCRVASESRTLQVGQTFIGTDPQPAAAILVDEGDTPRSQSVGDAIAGETAVGILVQSAVPGAKSISRPIDPEESDRPDPPTSPRVRRRQ